MIRRSLVLAGVLALGATTSAPAAPVTVNLRIEGATTTLFEGPVTTDVRQVDGHDGTGPHTCDGTNNNANPTPGPTFFGALADAADRAGFDWLGTWGQFGDEFSLDRIESDAADSSHFWSQMTNYVGNQVGGCQQRIQAGDDLEILYTSFDPNTFATQPALRLSGAPSRAAVGEPFSVRVDQTDGYSPAAPAPGATVAGATTGADGKATVSFDTPGVKRFKAEKAGAIRSNAAEVCVYAPGSGDCGTAGPAAPDGPGAPERSAASVLDTTAPRATIAGVHDGARYRRAPRIIRGHVDEDRGIHQVYLRLRMVDRRGCRWLSGRRETLTSSRTCASARYIRLGDAADWSYLVPLELPRARYILDVKVLDRALNRYLEQVRFRVVR
jgi:hypothetical protein